MLEAYLKRLRDDNMAIAQMLTGSETPLPPEPPFQVASEVTALQDRSMP
jgi:hypothetical protein